jgi:hypothetical protein
MYTFSDFFFKKITSFSVHLKMREFGSHRKGHTCQRPPKLNTCHIIDAP